MTLRTVTLILLKMHDNIMQCNILLHVQPTSGPSMLALKYPSRQGHIDVITKSREQFPGQGEHVKFFASSHCPAPHPDEEDVCYKL